MTWYQIGGYTVEQGERLHYGSGTLQDPQQSVNDWVMQLREQPFATLAEWSLDGGLSAFERETLREEPGTMWARGLPDDTHVRVVAHDATGQRVATFGEYPAVGLNGPDDGPIVPVERSEALAADCRLSVQVRFYEGDDLDRLDDDAAVHVPVTRVYRRGDEVSHVPVVVKPSCD